MRGPVLFAGLRFCLHDGYMTIDETPLYTRTTIQVGVVPEAIYLKCRILTSFVWPASRRKYTTPTPGTRPKRRK